VLDLGHADTCEEIGIVINLAEFLGTMCDIVDQVVFDLQRLEGISSTQATERGACGLCSIDTLW
jgi:hypothetical protein